MARYNSGRYNLDPYNRGGGRQDIEFTRRAYENIECVAGPGLTLRFFRDCSESVHNKTTLHILLPFYGSFSEVIHASAILRKYICAEIQADETIRSYVYLSKIMWVERDAPETILAGIHVGKIMHFTKSASEDINGRWVLGVLMLFSRYGAEHILGIVSAITVVYVNVEVDVTILPGQVLRIDSSVYTAFLDQLNVLHLYNGGWIFITPETLRIDVSTGDGNALTGELQYREMFV